MSEFGPIAIVGFGAFAVVLVLWLVISFSEPSRARSLLEWLGATHLYVALGSLFLTLVLDAQADESTIRLVAFGSLLFIFALGFVVSLVNTVREIGGGGDSDGATH